MKTSPSFFKGDSRPVERVSWHDAIAYCNARSLKEELTPAYEITDQGIIWKRDADGYRLPTEAEWEYAARAGSETAFYTGEAISKSQARFSVPQSQGTVNVGAFPPNPWGLYDMHGNVWEWCWDWYGEYDLETPADPAGPETGTIRVIRGGSWPFGPQRARSAFRFVAVPKGKHNGLGFRVARSRV
jgi:formylglycine-generating enzyme required for sulfatase activity